MFAKQECESNVSSNLTTSAHTPVAQLDEQQCSKLSFAGSNPAGSTMKLTNTVGHGEKVKGGFIIRLLNQSDETRLTLFMREVKEYDTYVVDCDKKTSEKLDLVRQSDSRRRNSS